MLQRTNAIQLTTNTQVYFQSTYNNNQIFKLSKMLSQQLLHFIDLLMTSKMLKKNQRNVSMDVEITGNY